MSREKLAAVTIVLTYFLIVFGGYVASSESGMGCGPEWPLCNGEVIPELQGETLIEFGHRVIGAVLFVLSIVLFVKVKKEKGSKQEKLVANWMIGLLTLQLIAGAIVVFYHLPSIVITIHLLIAMIFMSILTWFWRLTYTRIQLKNHSRIKKHLSFLATLLFITMALGAYIKHQHYGMACGYLECNDRVLPTTWPEFLQSSHRLFAFLSTIYILFLSVKVFSIGNNRLNIRMILALIIILVQLIIGVMTIVSTIAISFAVLHLAAATLLFAIVIETRIVMD
ncbi:COX15/CtaA family protein [Paucisalibacillus globulus]|uniref:COX15/CtaA family protein n=1 Tax=Paucisalibacillus globulus TaxID=351095 RepID=UPI000427FFDF|nr:COX15/CtaA family protein [Paucisalibacillus globulus]